MAYDVGDKIRLTATFLVPDNFGGIPTDPTAVTLKVMDPEEEVFTYVYGVDLIVKDSTGHYHYDLPLTLTGYYYHKWYGTGAVVAAAEQSINVQVSVFDE